MNKSILIPIGKAHDAAGMKEAAFRKHVLPRLRIKEYSSNAKYILRSELELLLRKDFEPEE